MDQLIKKHAKNLRLPYIAQNLHLHLEQSRLENQTYEEFLLTLFQYEVEQLEVTALPVEAQKHFKTLESLEFIKKNQNIILAGNPGTGKSHTAIGLGIKACQMGYHVYFAHVPTLIIELKEAKNERVLQRLKRKFDKYQLIILDELGYISFDKEGAELLFNFISTRCEKASTLFTTNLPFSRWDEIFHDPVITAAIVDRITHQSYVINMNGTSYRLQQSKKFLEIEQ